MAKSVGVFLLSFTKNGVDIQVQLWTPYFDSSFGQQSLTNQDVGFSVRALCAVFVALVANRYVQLPPAQRLMHLPPHAGHPCHPLTEARLQPRTTQPDQFFLCVYFSNPYYCCVPLFVGHVCWA